MKRYSGSNLEDMTIITARPSHSPVSSSSDLPSFDMASSRPSETFYNDIPLKTSAWIESNKDSGSTNLFTQP